MNYENKILRRVRKRGEATMKEQETRIAVLDHGKVDLTREVEMLSRKHMKSRRFHNPANPHMRGRLPDHPENPHARSL